MIKPSLPPGPFNIGEAARLSGVSAKMVRHYESLGLLPAVSRTDAGYRQYTEREVHTLRFVKRSRDLGFSMSEIAELLALWQDRRRSNSEVRSIALKQLAELEQRMTEMGAMKRTLEYLVACCHNDQRPECPILDELAAEEGPARGKKLSGQKALRGGALRFVH